jgi:hypothetical protein
MQQRVGVKGDDQLGPHRRQAGVEGVALAGTGLVDAADRLAGGRAERLGHGTGPVGGTVVDDEDLDGPQIVLAGDVGDRLLDPLGLVAGGDQHRDRDGRLGGAQRWLAVQQQADRQEGDEPAREVGDQGHDHDRRADRDGTGELADPWQRQPDRRPEPAERDPLGDHELHRDRGISAPLRRPRPNAAAIAGQRLLVGPDPVRRLAHAWLRHPRVVACPFERCRPARRFLKPAREPPAG